MPVRWAAASLLENPPAPSQEASLDHRQVSSHITCAAGTSVGGDFAAIQLYHTLGTSRWQGRPLPGALCISQAAVHGDLPGRNLAGSAMSSLRRNTAWFILPPLLIVDSSD